MKTAHNQAQAVLPAADSIYEKYRSESEEKIARFLDDILLDRTQWVRKNRYFYQQLKEIIADRLPPGSKVCIAGYDSYDLTDSLFPEQITAFCLTQKQKEHYASLHPKSRFFTLNEISELQEQFDYILIPSLGYFYDIQELLRDLHTLCHHRTKILILNYNFLWEPIFAVGEKIGLRMPQPLQRQNMVPTSHVNHLLEMSGFGLVQWSCHLLLPVFIPLLSWIANKFLAGSFPFRFLSSTHLIVARPQLKPQTLPRCSVIIPCKNERGNIHDIIARTPELAGGTELVLVDDKSNDGTLEEMLRIKAEYSHKTIKIVHGPGINKAEAVRTGICEASGDIIIILDGDLAQAPEELPKCIQPLTDGLADFVNTVRFVYPQHGKAMRWLNIVGNRGFAFIFTYLLRQRISDTLCGTKIFWKKDYTAIDYYKDNWIWRDQWGDFEQLLGASKIGLKIVDIPIHYVERVYGETKMNKRFKNGIHMLKLCLGGLFNLRWK